jgi:hypothetical protein
MTICHTNEFVQSPFLDGVLFIFNSIYIKWPLAKEVGWWMSERDDIRRGHWSQVKYPHLSHLFFYVKIDLYEFV